MTPRRTGGPSPPRQSPRPRAAGRRTRRPGTRPRGRRADPRRAGRRRPGIERGFWRGFRVFGGDLLVEEPEDPLRGGQRGLQDVVLVAHVPDRVVEPSGVFEERHERPEGDRAREQADAAPPQQQRHRDRGEHLHAREVDGVEVGEPHALRGVLPVQGVEPPLRLPLHPERLDHRHPRHVLLQEGVHPRELPPHLPVRLADPFFQQLDEQHEDGKDGEGDERKARVHPEQDRGRARQHRDVADRRDEAGGKELLERLDVGGKARHEASGRRAIEEDDGEPLHPREHLPAQGEDHPLAEDRHRVHLQVEEPHRADEGPEIQEDPPPIPESARSSRTGR